MTHIHILNNDKNRKITYSNLKYTNKKHAHKKEYKNQNIKKSFLIKMQKKKRKNKAQNTY